MMKILANRLDGMDWILMDSSAGGFKCHLLPTHCLGAVAAEG